MNSSILPPSDEELRAEITLSIGDVLADAATALHDEGFISLAKGCDAARLTIAALIKRATDCESREGEMGAKFARREVRHSTPPAGFEMADTAADDMARALVIDVAACRASCDMLVRRLAMDLQEARAERGEPFNCPPSRLEALMRVGAAAVHAKAAEIVGGADGATRADETEYQSAVNRRDRLAQAAVDDSPINPIVTSTDPVDVLRYLISDMECARNALDAKDPEVAKVHLRHAAIALGIVKVGRAG